MPRPSRYLATVLLATCMPSFKSSSDSVASDIGRDAFSPVIMRLIMAWIAVAEQTPPIVVCTLLEKQNLSSYSPSDRTSVEYGKNVLVRVDLGGSRLITTKI